MDDFIAKEFARFRISGVTRILLSPVVLARWACAPAVSTGERGVHAMTCACKIDDGGDSDGERIGQWPCPHSQVG